jgi:hypothetical protein
MCVTAVALLCVTTPRYAGGLEIALSYAGGFENRPDAVAAIQQAAESWEAALGDPVTISIEVREVSIFELPFGASGAAFPIYEGRPTTRCERRSRPMLLRPTIRSR